MRLERDTDEMPGGFAKSMRSELTRRHQAQAKRYGDSTSNHRAMACYVMGDSRFRIKDAVLTCSAHGKIG